jgi:hypothetical protein
VFFIILDELTFKTKIMTRFLLLCLVLSSSSLFAQNEMLDTSKWTMEIYDGDTIYYQKPTRGDLARQDGDLMKAISYFRADIEADPTDQTLMYNLACVYALQRRSDSAFYYLNISSATDTNVFALNDPDFYFLIDSPEWADFTDEAVAKVEAKYGAYENIELSKELWTMSLKDQAFYYHLELAEKQSGRRSPVVSALWELKSKINAENVNRLEEIIVEYGWPKISLVGGNAANAVFLIIQHADLEVQKKYLPMMKEAANGNEADWSSLALLIDRINLREGKPQIYGSQIGINENGEYYVSDLEDPKYVNQRRASVGLGTIQEYVSNWGIEWTVKQKEK